jgi:hypothetical protein
MSIKMQAGGAIKTIIPPLSAVSLMLAKVSFSSLLSIALKIASFSAFN